jgi:5-hydroxyisourate hydrolase
MSPITTHVLDLSKGRPAAGVPVVLEHEHPNGWHRLGRGITDEDGRLKSLLPDGAELVIGNYRLSFDTAAYFAESGVPSFYPTVIITFSVAAPRDHYHVPLLLSPFGYSTYRGS